jgi:K+-transporting ATPase ATPase C chain
MYRHLRANLWLLLLTLLVGSIVYPALLWAFAQGVFPEQAQGSLLLDRQKKPVGSRLIAQPFRSDEYFQPRPSAAGYNGAASGATNWAANNYLLRNRVARQLGPIVRHRSGPRKSQPAAPDVESWFREDRYQGRPGIVAQWAQAHPGLAEAWVKADPLNAEYVAAWQKASPQEIAQWIRDHPGTPDPKPEDLAVPFFVSYSKTSPGTFPGAVEEKTAGDKTVKRISPLKEGTDIQSIFFDMWIQDHPQADLEPVPADMVMASGSGLDPHLTLKSALYQLDRVAGAWAEKTKGDREKIRQEIAVLLEARAEAPLGGLVGVKQINVLETNLALRDRYGSPEATGR